MTPNSSHKHVELIARHEQDYLNQRTTSERIGDVIAGSAGSLKFVGIHLAIFAAWITLNVSPGRRHFDPAPFSLLSRFVTFEAILLASFIHGTFNSQVYGIWRVIVPDAHPLLGGFGGLIGLGALAGLAAWAWRNRVCLEEGP